MKAGDLGSLAGAQLGAGHQRVSVVRSLLGRGAGLTGVRARLGLIAHPPAPLLVFPSDRGFTPPGIPDVSKQVVAEGDGRGFRGVSGGGQEGQSRLVAW